MSKSVVKEIGKLFYSLVVHLVKPVRMTVSKISTFRRLAFDSSRRDSFSVVNCGKEFFVVSTNDPTIARSVFVKKRSFDFQKFEEAIKLLPAKHNRESLFDIGANIGTISISAIKRQHFQKATAVEPDPLNYRLLATNIQLNDVSDKFTCYKAAVGGNDGGSALLGLSKINHGDHRILWDKPDKTEKGRESLEVGIIGMDRIVDNFDANSSFIWMDIQGHEGHALYNAEKLKKSGIPMCIEFWPYGLQQSGGYELLKDSLLDGSWNTFIDLDNPEMRIPLNSKELDKLFDKIGLESSGTDILVLDEK